MLLKPFLIKPVIENHIDQDLLIYVKDNISVFETQQEDFNSKQKDKDKITQRHLMIIFSCNHDLYIFIVI